MLKQAFHNGALAASKHFGVREASALMDILTGIGTPMVARAGLNTLAPKLVPTIEKHLEVPFRGLKNIGQRAVGAFRGPSTPAEALAHGLSGAPAQAPIRDPGAFVEHMSRGPR